MNFSHYFSFAHGKKTKLKKTELLRSSHSLFDQALSAAWASLLGCMTGQAGLLGQSGLAALLGLALWLACLAG